MCLIYIALFFVIAWNLSDWKIGLKYLYNYIIIYFNKYRGFMKMRICVAIFMLLTVSCVAKKFDYKAFEQKMIAEYQFVQNGEVEQGVDESGNDIVTIDLMKGENVIQGLAIKIINGKSISDNPNIIKERMGDLDAPEGGTITVLQENDNYAEVSLNLMFFELFTFLIKKGDTMIVLMGSNSAEYVEIRDDLLGVSK